MPRVCLEDLADEEALGYLLGQRLPWGDLWLVNLAGAANAETSVLARAAVVAARLPGTTIGVSDQPVPPTAAPLLEALSLTIAPSGPGLTWVAVEDTPACLAEIEATVALAPLACETLHMLLDLTIGLSARRGVVAESLAYSTLLAGPEFAAWFSARPLVDAPEDETPAVRLERHPQDVLVVTLNRPHRHNAFSARMRDELLDALDVARLDATIGELVLRGSGPSFCAGGDLAEFGSTPDPSTAHCLRVAHSVGLTLDGLGSRVRAELHGACIGAGIEIPAFAGRVVASPDAWFRLPELRMGLIPGAGGTVSIPRRIGRWRTTWLLLTGRDLDAKTALAWGLVDSIE